ncbi:MAG: radical SAM protein [Candidatus Omnitrophota bacterium]|nr:radical SAM protein [Candidatus Omnitrophota bacterium]
MLSSPFNVCFGITSKCNLNCKHCCASSTRQNPDLTTAELLKIIDQLGQAKVFNVSVFGGEPLAHSDFFKIIARFKKYPIQISLNTNAGLIDKAVARRLVDSGIKSFTVSFDGSRAEVMDAMRGKGAFEGCIRGVKNLRERGASILLSCTVTGYNIHDIKGMVLLAKSLRVKSIRFNHAFCGGNAACFKDEVMVKPKEELEAIKEIYSLHQEFGDFVTGSYLQQQEKLSKINDFKPERDKIKIPPCGAAVNKCSIRSDGKVTPCEIIWDLEAGDLRKQSFLDIWRNSAVFKQLRSVKIVSLKDKPDCQGCKYQYICFIGHRCVPYYFPEGFKDKSLYCWKEIELKEVYSLAIK